MSKAFTKRLPQKSGGFSWGRLALGDTGIVSYRLFRRDHRGALHWHILDFKGDESRYEMAQRLKAAKRRLRDRVDEIDLAAMGVAA